MVVVGNANFGNYSITDELVAKTSARRPEHTTKLTSLDTDGVQEESTAVAHDSKTDSRSDHQRDEVVQHLSHTYSFESRPRTKIEQNAEQHPHQ
jgi:hypothetical protein